MPKFEDDPVVSVSNSTTTPAVLGEGRGNEGVRAVSHNAHGAVVGINDFAPAAPPGAGGNGGWFERTQGEGVRGWAKTPHHSGVVGVNTAGGFGVYGKSDGQGVVGESTKADGVFGSSSQAAGVHGRGPTGGFFEGGSAAGVHAINLGNGAAVHAVANGTGAAIAAVGGGGGNHAGIFNGNVTVTKNITAYDVIISGADCAEDFDVMSSAHTEPGTVMVIGDDARLVESQRAYDKRVAGIISGAGDYKPGIVLGKDVSREDRVPLALIGKVFCKVDATYAPIEVGDLLTTSPTQGHAMKAEDPLKAFGAVIGKALAPLREGQSLVPILVALQ